MPDNELTHVTGQDVLVPDKPEDMLSLVMRAAADPNVDPARLEKFLQIGRELQADKAKQQWAIAFRSAKDEIDNIEFTKRGHIVYKDGSVVKFMQYDDIAEAVKPILKKYQLTSSYTYRHEATPPKTICVLTLLHSGGHSEKFESIPMPMLDQSGGKTDIQAAGSIMTYGRRYAIQAAFDIVAAGQDDDGTLGKEQPKPITERELETISNIVQACEDKNPGFRKLFTNWLFKQMKIDEIKSLRQGTQLKSVMEKLNAKMKELGIQ